MERDSAVNGAGRFASGAFLGGAERIPLGALSALFPLARRSSAPAAGMGRSVSIEHRARHTMLSFQRSYSRGIAARLRNAFIYNAHKRKLRFEEASRL